MVNEKELSLIHKFYMEETGCTANTIVSVHELIDWEYVVVNNEGTFYLVDTNEQCCVELEEIWRAAK